jgi:hypothetical protein
MLPGSSEPGRAVAGDEGHVGERLDVLHERGQAADAAFEDRRAFEGWLGQAAADPAGQGRFLAGQEPWWRGHQFDRDPVTAGRGPLGERSGQQAMQLIVPVHIQAGPLGTDRAGG